MMLSAVRGRLSLAARNTRPSAALASAVRGYRPLSRDEMTSDVISHCSELQGERLFILANGGDLEAKREMLRREIMRVDGGDYIDTTPKLVEISDATTEGLAMTKLPYQLLAGSVLFAGWVSIPLVFYPPLVDVFNTHMVTMEVPPPDDLDTILETGSWAWNWMEPPLGTLSFTVLCIQYAAEQRKHIGLKTAEERICERMGEKIVARYPAYNASIVRAYAEATAIHDDTPAILEDHDHIVSLMEKGEHSKVKPA